MVSADTGRLDILIIDDEDDLRARAETPTVGKSSPMDKVLRVARRLIGHA